MDSLLILIPAALPFEPALIRKTYVPTVADNDMIEYGDAQQTAGFRQSVCQSPIFLAWSRITAGVVMQKDHGGGGFTNRTGEHLSGVHDAECQRSFRHGGFLDDGVLSVKEHDLEEFLFAITKDGVKVFEKIGAR
jgi:hypothetical protein